MSDSHQRLKQKVIHKTREYLVISFYLFVVFSLFEVYRSLILASHGIDYALHGLALINALPLGKVILVAQELYLGDQLRDAPLIYPTLLKSFVFTVVLACFKIAERFAVGSFHGKSFHESIADLGGGTWEGILTVAALLSFMLILFWASPSYGDSSVQTGSSRFSSAHGIWWIYLPQDRSATG